MRKFVYGFLCIRDWKIQVIHLIREAFCRQKEEKGEDLTNSVEQEVLADWSIPREASCSAKSWHL